MEGVEVSFMWLGIAALVILGGGFLIEKHGQGRLPWAYFRIAVPLGQQILPLTGLPEGKGSASGIGWEAVPEKQRSRYWTERGGYFPFGLHGWARFRRYGSKVQVEMFWAPPLTAVLAILWLVGVAIARGDNPMIGLLAAGLLGLVLMLHHQAAVRAARVLRQVWAENPAR